MWSMNEVEGKDAEGGGVRNVSGPCSNCVGIVPYLGCVKGRVSLHYFVLIFALYRIALV